VSRKRAIFAKKLQEAQAKAQQRLLHARKLLALAAETLIRNSGARLRLLHQFRYRRIVFAKREGRRVEPGAAEAAAREEAAHSCCGETKRGTMERDTIAGTVSEPGNIVFSRRESGRIKPKPAEVAAPEKAARRVADATCAGHAARARRRLLRQFRAQEIMSQEREGRRVELWCKWRLIR